MTNNSPLPDTTDPTWNWKRGSRCDGGQCLSLAVLPGSRVAIRNDNQPDVVLVATRAELSVLVAGWIAGEFAPEATR